MEEVRSQSVPMVENLLKMVDGKELPGMANSLLSRRLNAAVIRTSPESMVGLTTGPSEIGTVR